MSLDIIPMSHKKTLVLKMGFYPLGSCTMKYNPKINDELATLSGFANIHPLQPVETVQGLLKIYYEHKTCYLKYQV
jgi:glycine dehydrogenase subunit 2